MTDPAPPRRARWKTALVIVGAALAIGAVIFALGPRTVVDEGSMLPVRPPPEAPAELDRYLAEMEARLDDLTPETERRIFWADPQAPARTPLSLVYLHGFSATRQEVSPVAEDAARALGANLYMARLRGHGRPGVALAQARAENWMEDAVEAMAIGERIGERVVLVGCSTGGTLAVWLSQWLGSEAAFGPTKRPPAALVLLAPNFGAADPTARVLTWPWGEALTGRLLGETYTWEPANDGQRRFWTWSHPPRALVAMQALVDHVDRLPAAAPDLPALVIWSTRDQVVDTAAIERWVAANPQRRQPMPLTDDVHRGNHVLAGRIMAPSRTARVTGAIVDFVRQAVPATP